METWRVFPLSDNRNQSAGFEVRDIAKRERSTIVSRCTARIRPRWNSEGIPSRVVAENQGSHRASWHSPGKQIIKTVVFVRGKIPGREICHRKGYAASWIAWSAITCLDQAGSSDRTPYRKSTQTGAIGKQRNVGGAHHAWREKIFAKEGADSLTGFVYTSERAPALASRIARTTASTWRTLHLCCVSRAGHDDSSRAKSLWACFLERNGELDFSSRKGQKVARDYGELRVCRDLCTRVDLSIKIKDTRCLATRHACFIVFHL